MDIYLCNISILLKKGQAYFEIFGKNLSFIVQDFSFKILNILLEFYQDRTLYFQ